MSEIKKFESQELSIIKVNNLKALKDAGETLENLVKENAFIEPTDETINEAEKRRKALKIGRTTVNRYEKEIKGSLSKASKCVSEITIELREIIEPAERKQESANIKFFDTQAWEEAKEADTKEAYSNYARDYSIFFNDASMKIEEIEIKEAEAKKVYETWIRDINQALILAKTIEDLDDIEKMLDEEDTEKFLDPSASFDKREEFYNVIDLKRNDIEKAEKERKEREAKEAKEKEEAAKLKIKLEKEKKEREKREAAEKIRLQKEADERKKREAAEKIKREKEEAKRKKDRQAENFENAEIIFDSINISIDNLDTIEKTNLYSGKLENTIEKDFGSKDDEIRTLYTKVRTKLEDRRNVLILEAQKKKAEEAKIEREKKAEAVKNNTGVGAPIYKISPSKIIDKKQKNAAISAKQKNDCLTQIKSDLSEEVKNVIAEHKNMIEKYSLKQDIVDYISGLL